MSIIASIAQLEAFYGQPAAAATVKEVAYTTPHYRAHIEASPYATLATSAPEGLDCSPRGDKPDFVRVHDERTLMLASAGQILAASSDSKVGGETYDREWPGRAAKSMW